jgi:anaerobic magnesium-protoporphyrin IX monomethyl ester cyclase
VWQREGRRERRLPVERVVAYILESFERAPFDYVAMYAPTFTLRRSWVLELCDALDACGRQVRWKCTTTVERLDEDLLSRMAASGCVRVSVGVETLEPAALAMLPASKRCEERRVETLAATCTALGVELNCFVILGLPGSTVDGIRSTVDRLRSWGARVRPMLYAAYERMEPGMDERQVAMFNRQVAQDHADSDDAAALYSLFHGA